MNKSELINVISSDANISKQEAKNALESVLNNVKSALKNGDKVMLVGFGTWSVSERAARDGRNPRTGEVLKIAAKKVVKFKAGSEFSDELN